MAEVLGTIASALTLAGIFKVCLEAFEFIRAAKHHDAEVKKLTLKLKIEKCRLLIWGRSMGLIKENEEPTDSSLDDYQFADLIRETLESILELLSNSQALAIKYGCRQVDEVAADALLLDNGPLEPSERLHAVFSKRRLDKKVASRLKDATRKTVWVIHDHKKFSKLVLDAKDFVDALQDITQLRVPLRGQEHAFTSRINTIKDPETLNMIAEVCETDHPSFSEAASIRADTITMTATEKQDVAEWIDDAECYSELSTIVEDVESLSITDLKHRYVALLSAKSQDTDETPEAPALDPWNLDYCRVLRDHTISTRTAWGRGYHDELDCVRGDLVAVLSKVDSTGKGRWQCRSRGGRVGWLPPTSLQMIHTHNPDQEAPANVHPASSTDTPPLGPRQGPPAPSLLTTEAVSDQDQLRQDQRLKSAALLEEISSSEFRTRRSDLPAGNDTTQSNSASASVFPAMSGRTDLKIDSSSKKTRSGNSYTTFSYIGQAIAGRITPISNLMVVSPTTAEVPSTGKDTEAATPKRLSSLRLAASTTPSKISFQPLLKKVWPVKTASSSKSSVADGRHSLDSIQTEYSNLTQIKDGENTAEASTTGSTVYGTKTLGAATDDYPRTRADGHARWEWDFQIRNFTEYYINQDKSLDEAVRMMVKKHGFHATAQQWQDELEKQAIHKTAEQWSAKADGEG